MNSSSVSFNPSTLFLKPVAAADVAPVPPEIALCEVLPHNQALIRFVMQHQPISAGALFASYGDAGDSFESFARRLTYLRSKRWLLKDSEGRSALYRFNTERTSRPVKAGPARAAKVAPGAGHHAPPRRCNVMAGTYRPAPPPAQRPGSDDFLSLCSMRGGERVAYVPGYIFY